MNKVNRKFFAAYGSLINVDKMILVCQESYAFGWGNIRDFKLEFRMLENINKSVGSIVPVVLWSITEVDEMELDSFFNLEVYRKEELKVILTDVNDIVAPYSADYYREGIKALVYIMKEENISPKKAPRLELYQSILDGYRQNNIEPDTLTKAVIQAENDNDRSFNVEKPTAALVGANGNIFNLMGIALQALKRAGQREQAEVMQKRITTEASNYDEAIQIIMEYVDVV